MLLQYAAAPLSEGRSVKTMTWGQSCRVVVHGIRRNENSDARSEDENFKSTGGIQKRHTGA